MRGDDAAVRSPRSSATSLGGELVAAAAAVACAVGCSWLLRDLLPTASLSLVFLLAVLAVALRRGTYPALVAAGLSFLAYNFFFTEPRYSLRIHSAHDVVAVFAYLFAAFAVGQLASRQRRQLVELRSAHAESGLLRELGERLSTSVDVRQVYGAACRALVPAVATRAVAMPLPASGGADPVPLAWAPSELRLLEAELELCREALRRLSGGVHRAPEPVGDARVYPVETAAGLSALLIVWPASGPEASRVLASAAVQIAHQTGQAAERIRLVESVEAARLDHQTEQLRTALLSSVSHDLRSPLAAILGAATSLEAYGSSMGESDRAQLLESIRSESERLDRHIQNLLDMARLGAGPVRLQRDWIGLDELVRAATARLLRLSPGRSVELDLEPELPPLHLHGALIEQALFNLLENADKFSPAGVPILVAARRDGEAVVLDVSDQGPGIPESERDKVFDLFFSAVRGDRGASGTGLGLSIVRGLVAAHGGSVRALASDSGGATFRIRLPATEPPPLHLEESA